MTFITFDARLLPTATLCMPGFPPSPRVRCRKACITLPYLTYSVYYRYVLSLSEKSVDYSTVHVRPLHAKSPYASIPPPVYIRALDVS